MSVFSKRGFPRVRPFLRTVFSYKVVTVRGAGLRRPKVARNARTNFERRAALGATSCAIVIFSRAPWRSRGVRCHAGQARRRVRRCCQQRKCRRSNGVRSYARQTRPRWHGLCQVRNAFNFSWDPGRSRGVRLYADQSRPAYPCVAKRFERLRSYRVKCLG